MKRAKKLTIPAVGVAVAAVMGVQAILFGLNSTYSLRTCLPLRTRIIACCAKRCSDS